MCVHLIVELIALATEWIFFSSNQDLELWSTILQSMTRWMIYPPSLISFHSFHWFSVFPIERFLWNETEFTPQLPWFGVSEHGKYCNSYSDYQTSSVSAEIRNSFKFDFSINADRDSDRDSGDVCSQNVSSKKNIFCLFEKRSFLFMHLLHRDRLKN